MKMGARRAHRFHQVTGAGEEAARDMSIQDLKDRLPDYARDLKLNRGALALG